MGYKQNEPPSWLKTLFNALDTFDAKTFASFLTDDATFIFANAEPVRGKATIQDAVAGFFSSIKAIRHDMSDCWVLPDAVISRGIVTYTRHSGTQLRVPFANIFNMRNERIQDYLIYVDNSQLYTQP
jgi:ketosteroid isomerase-like protein